MAANSRVIPAGEFDKWSIITAFACVQCDELKRIAQRCREYKDWYGHEHKNDLLYECAMKIIHITEPDWQTQFIPAQ